MTLGELAQLGVVTALIVIGALAERRVMGNETLVSAPGWVQTVLAGLALAGPWFLYFQGLVPSTLVDGMILALAASLVLWLAVMKTTGVGGARGGAC